MRFLDHAEQTTHTAQLLASSAMAVVASQELGDGDGRLGFRVHGLGFTVSGCFGFWGLGLRVWDLGFRVARTLTIDRALSYDVGKETLHAWYLNPLNRKTLNPKRLKVCSRMRRCLNPRSPRKKKRILVVQI